MQRLRPLSEEECYLRCYGWRGSEDTVKVVRAGDPVIVESTAVLTERIRLAFEARLDSARARSGIAESGQTPSAVPDVLAPGLARRLLRDQPRPLLRQRRTRTSRTPATTSGGSSTRPASRRVSSSPTEQFDLLPLGIGVTNAAYRTTPGSGDLRAGDFAGSAERLEALARELRPGVIAFVGKEAYRGRSASGPSTGSRRGGSAETALFVLPSTSPANAAVPWEERLRWFTACELVAPATT